VEVSRILAEIDSQISKLQQARSILAETSAAPVVRVGRGRPKGSKNSATKAASKPSAKTTVAKVAAPGAAKGKRKLSPEGRKRIADAMKKRWAERRKLIAK
jgi:hypothetical protein